MSLTNLPETAAGLPETWDSVLLGHVGTAALKVLRMDELPRSEERHDTAEALLVLDGVLELEVAGRAVSVRTGELCLVPPATAHTVRPGSRGTLLIVE